MQLGNTRFKKIVIFGNQSKSLDPPPPPLYLGLTEMKFYKSVCINPGWFEMHFELNSIFWIRFHLTTAFFNKLALNLS